MSAPILPRYQKAAERDADQRRIARAILDSDKPDATPLTSRTKTRTDHTDKQRLRGIPVAGGATGTCPNTDPLQAVLRTAR